jgi:hypothetical protein
MHTLLLQGRQFGINSLGTSPNAHFFERLKCEQAPDILRFRRFFALCRKMDLTTQVLMRRPWHVGLLQYL